MRTCATDSGQSTSRTRRPCRDKETRSGRPDRAWGWGRVGRSLPSGWPANCPARPTFGKLAEIEAIAGGRAIQRPLHKQGKAQECPPLASATREGAIKWGSAVVIGAPLELGPWSIPWQRAGSAGAQLVLGYDRRLNDLADCLDAAVHRALLPGWVHTSSAGAAVSGGGAMESAMLLPTRPPGDLPYPYLIAGSLAALWTANMPLYSLSKVAPWLDFWHPSGVGCWVAPAGAPKRPCRAPAAAPLSQLLAPAWHFLKGYRAAPEGAPRRTSRPSKGAAGGGSGHRQPPPRRRKARV